MKKFITISILIFYLFQVSGQVRVQSAYLGAGFQYIEPIRFFEIPNDEYSINPIGTGPLNDLYGFNLGIISKIDHIPKLKLDLSFYYLKSFNYNGTFWTFKKHYGLPENGYRFLGYSENLTSGEFAEFKYGFLFRTFIIEFSSYIKLIDKKWFFIDLGAGINLAYCKLHQDGVNLNYSTYPFITSQDSEMDTNWDLSVQSSLVFGIQLSERFAIDATLNYRSIKVENMGAENLLWNEFGADDENSSTYPISNTTIDITGFNYMLQFRYCFTE